MNDSPHLMPCQEAVRQMWNNLDGAAPEHAGVEAHLAFCLRCCGELEFVEHLRDLLASQATEDIPPQMTRKLERFIEEL
jgi:hypothetical protein